MARLLHGSSWFDELGPVSFYESEFERFILAKSDLMFPDYHVVDFKPLVYSEYGSGRPDLALVEKSYREWWVVEVELGGHSLDAHVVPQVRILSSAVYGEPEAHLLCASHADLVRGKILDMMKGNQPKVLVLVNVDAPNWVEPLRRHDAQLAVVQVFRSDMNEHIVRVDGLPIGQLSFISECYFDPLLPRFLVVESPAVLGVGPGEKVQVQSAGCISEWRRVDSSDKVWLSPLGKTPVAQDQRYRLSRARDGVLTLEAWSGRTRR